MTYAKLFVAMGLTWSVEILAWFLSGTEERAPEGVIIALNMLNVCQGPIVFYVFAMKPSTKQKLAKTISREKTHAVSSEYHRLKKIIYRLQK